MRTIIDDEDALLHAGHALKDFLQRTDFLNVAQVDVDNERLDVAALDTGPQQQFGGHGMLALQHGANGRKPRRRVCYQVDRHGSKVGCIRKFCGLITIHLCSELRAFLSWALMNLTPTCVPSTQTSSQRRNARPVEERSRKNSRALSTSGEPSTSSLAPVCEM